MKIESVAPLMAYVTVGIGLFCTHSAWIAILGFHAGLILILFLERPGIPLASLIRGNHIPTLIGCVFLGASSGLLLYLAWPIFSISPDLAADLASIGLTRAAWPGFIAYAALVNPWIEEYFWRGYLGSDSRKVLPIDFLFAGFHLLILYGKTNWAWMLFSLLVLTFASWVWRGVHRKTGGLLIPVLSHAAADLSILMAVYSMTE